MHHAKLNLLIASNISKFLGVACLFDSQPGKAGRWAFAEMRQIVVREVAHVPETAANGNGLH
jgi:hypothetical protein